MGGTVWSPDRELCSVLTWRRSVYPNRSLLFCLKVVGDCPLPHYAGQQLIAINDMPHLVCDCDVCESVIVHLTSFEKRLMHVVCCFRNLVYGQTYTIAGDGVCHRTNHYVSPNHQEFGSRIGSPMFK